jgi:hypothetical protein
MLLRVATLDADQNHEAGLDGAHRLGVYAHFRVADALQQSNHGHEDSRRCADREICDLWFHLESSESAFLGLQIPLENNCDAYGGRSIKNDVKWAAPSM